MLVDKPTGTPGAAGGGSVPVVALGGWLSCGPTCRARIALALAYIACLAALLGGPGGCLDGNGPALPGGIVSVGTPPPADSV